MGDNLFICRICKEYKPGKQFNTRGMNIWCSTCKECRILRRSTKNLRKKSRKARNRAKKKLAVERCLAIQKQIKAGNYVDLPNDTSGAGGTYTERNANLRVLGFKNYKLYMKSDLWRSIRSKVFATKGRICELCAQNAVIVHHNWYGVADLLGARLCNLHPLCIKCHDIIEFNNGKKNKHHETRQKFYDIVKNKLS